mgnify:CR=1 FL=1
MGNAYYYTLLYNQTVFELLREKRRKEAGFIRQKCDGGRSKIPRTLGRRLYRHI